MRHDLQLHQLGHYNVNWVSGVMFLLFAIIGGTFIDAAISQSVPTSYMIIPFIIITTALAILNFWAIIFRRDYAFINWTSGVVLLIIAIALTVIQIGNIYNKGLTLKEVNQTGRDLGEDIRHTIAIGGTVDLTHDFVEVMEFSPT